MHGSTDIAWTRITGSPGATWGSGGLGARHDRRTSSPAFKQVGWGHGLRSIYLVGFQEYSLAQRGEELLIRLGVLDGTDVVWRVGAREHPRDFYVYRCSNNRCRSHKTRRNPAGAEILSHRRRTPITSLGRLRRRTGLSARRRLLLSERSLGPSSRGSPGRRVGGRGAFFTFGRGGFFLRGRFGSGGRRGLGRRRGSRRGSFGSRSIRSG